MFENRKQSHLELALAAQNSSPSDDRFFYEPLLSAHPKSDDLTTSFLNQTLSMPYLISSMTGGWERAREINQNLAMSCGEMKLAMGLGSCRSLLESDEHLGDFQVRAYLGNQPLLANLGIAQIEKLVLGKQTKKITELINKLECDGLIIHINPLQEWVQAEGDRLTLAPIETLKRFFDHFHSHPVIVKEVGQGFGPASLKAMRELPLLAIDLAGSGGTNFTKLEAMRKGQQTSLQTVGHSCNEMLDWLQHLANPHHQATIISGGVKTATDAHYFTQKVSGVALIAQGAQLLAPALAGAQALQDYFQQFHQEWLASKAYFVGRSDGAN
jgi:isopentenyl-diphosphate delta-isomerase